MTDASKKPLVAIIATGGTIASERGADGASRPSLGGDSLLGTLSDTGCELRTVDLLAKDSASLTLADMQLISTTVGRLLADPDIDGIVVLHGTDAMEETSLLVQLQNTVSKPVIFTGAQFTADHPQSDGPANMRDAVLAASDKVNSGRGVLVCFGGRICPAWNLYKHSSDQTDAFRQTNDAENPALLLEGDVSDLRVDLIAIHPGCDGVLVDASANAGANGVVLTALGSGNATPDVVAAVRRCAERGIPVVVSSRVPQGALYPSYGGGGGGHDLTDAGSLHARHLRPGQTRILLAALIAAGQNDKSVQKSAFEI